MRKELFKLNLVHFFLSLVFISPVVVFFFKERGLGLSQILILESILALFIFLFEVPTGIFADKFGRKESIIAGIATFFVATVMMFFANGFLAFAVIFALTGISTTFMTGSVEALIYDALKEQGKTAQMKKAMGNYGFSSLMGKFAAPVIGAYIARDLIPVQFTVLIYLTLFAVIAAFVLSFSLKEAKERPGNRNVSSPLAIFSQGFQLMHSDKVLMRIVFLDILTTPFVFELKYLSQQNFKNAGIGVPVFGLIFGVALLLSAFAKKYAYKFEAFFGMKKAVFFITLAPGLCFLLLALISDPLWLIVSFIFIRVSAEASGPLFSEYRNNHIPSAARATVISLISMLGCFYLMFARLIIGKLADMHLGYAFAFMGAVIVAASLVLRIEEAHVKAPVFACAEV